MTPANLIDHWSFEPDGARVAALSGEVNRRLISSLRYIFDALEEELGCPAERFAAWIDRLEAAERASPLVHVIFHSIVADVDDMPAAQALVPRLLASGAASSGLTIHTLVRDPEGERPVSLFSRFADTEEENSLDFVEPEPVSLARSKAILEEGLELIRANDPQMDAELRALLSEVLMVEQAPTHRFATAAVSCFQNWGGLLMAPAAGGHPLDVVDMLAHEATHLILFALAMDEPLVTNPPEERFFSPIRQKLRSMDGVFHAAIVSARVSRAMLRQAEASVDPEHRQRALARALESAELFEEGRQVIEQGAGLTAIGRRILDDSMRHVRLLRARAEELAASDLAPAAG